MNVIFLSLKTCELSIQKHHDFGPMTVEICGFSRIDNKMSNFFIIVKQQCPVNFGQVLHCCSNFCNVLSAVIPAKFDFSDISHWMKRTLDSDCSFHFLSSQKYKYFDTLLSWQYHCSVILKIRLIVRKYVNGR